MGTSSQGYETLKALAGDHLISPITDYHNNRSLLSFSCSCGRIFHATKYLYEKSRDDLISSGITMDKVVRKLQLKFKKAKIHPVVFDDENSDGVAFIRPHPKQWIVFPYE